MVSCDRLTSLGYVCERIKPDFRIYGNVLIRILRAFIPTEDVLYGGKAAGLYGKRYSLPFGKEFSRMNVYKTEKQEREIESHG